MSFDLVIYDKAAKQLIKENSNEPKKENKSGIQILNLYEIEVIKDFYYEKQGLDLIVSTEIQNDNFTNNCKIKKLSLGIPLKFWFNNNPNSATPLVALPYHNIPNYKKPSFGDIVTILLPKYGDFFMIPFTYLKVELPKIEINMDQIGDENEYDNSDIIKIIDKIGHPLIKNVSLEIGGNKIDEQNEDFLNIQNELVSYNSYSNKKSNDFNEIKAYNDYLYPLNEKVYTYSFALYPEEHQPSGSINIHKTSNIFTEYRANKRQSSKKYKQTNKENKEYMAYNYIDKYANF